MAGATLRERLGGEYGPGKHRQQRRPLSQCRIAILVGLVGQEILRGKHIREGGVSCEDWLHYVISLVCHDIGYVKGVCRQDGNGLYATGKDGAMVSLPPGASDASLTPYHVDRAKLFIDERYGCATLRDWRSQAN